jgi:hypothetical protein
MSDIINRICISCNIPWTTKAATTGTLPDASKAFVCPQCAHEASGRPTYSAYGFPHPNEDSGLVEPGTITYRYKPAIITAVEDCLTQENTKLKKKIEELSRVNLRTGLVRFLLGLAILGLAIAVMCSSCAVVPAPGPGPTCITSSHCLPDEVCVGGMCTFQGHLPGTPSLTCACHTNSTDHVGEMRRNPNCMSGWDILQLCEGCCETWNYECVSSPYGRFCM